MSSATLTKMIRKFESVVYSPGMSYLHPRNKTISALETTLQPCLYCRQNKVRKADGQIVRFCSKECKQQFKHGYILHSK